MVQRQIDPQTKKTFDPEILRVRGKRSREKYPNDGQRNHGPLTRVARYFNLRDEKNAQRWKDFQSEFGQRNYNVGQVRDPGTMSVTYFNTNQMSTMFARKFPDYSQSKTIKSMRSVTKEFGHFVQGNINVVHEALNDPKIAADPYAYKHWQAACFPLDSTKKLVPTDSSKLRIGFALSEDTLSVLEQEKLDMISFFKREKFDTRDLGGDPIHLTSMKLFVPLGKIGIKAGELTVPDGYSLHEPKMTVYDPITQEVKSS